MNKQQAKQFIMDLFDQVWSAMDADRVGDFYDEKVIVTIGQQTVGFDEIINRAKLVKQHYKQLINQIDDMLIDGDKITVRLRQTAIYKHEDREQNYYLLAIYQLKKNKITHIWANIDPTIDYFEIDG